MANRLFLFQYRPSASIVPGAKEAVCPFSDLAVPFYSVARFRTCARMCRQRISEGNRSLLLYHSPVQSSGVGCLALNGEQLRPSSDGLDFLRIALTNRDIPRWCNIP